MTEYVLGIIREFETANFHVIVDALEDYDLDLSFDDTGEVRDKLESGEFISFTARCRVVHIKLGELGVDYLGGCIYESLEDFMDHKECAAQTRELKAKGSSAICGSYFADLVSDAIKEARNNILEAQSIKVRE